MTEMFNL